jgi:hypothetical protein
VGLPKEQLACFGRDMLEWLDSDSTEALSGQVELEAEWNVLVFDVGGGTTDIALIRLTMRDETEPQSEDASRRGGQWSLLHDDAGDPGLVWAHAARG